MAFIAALTSFKPLPVLMTRTGSLDLIIPFSTALTNPAKEAAPAGSAKIPILPNFAIAEMISSSLTIMYPPPVSAPL